MRASPRPLKMANFFLAHLTLRLLRKSEKESAPYELSQAHHDRARSHSGFLPRTGCLSRDADRGSDWRIGWGYDSPGRPIALARCGPEPRFIRSRSRLGCRGPEPCAAG